MKGCSAMLTGGPTETSLAQTPRMMLPELIHGRYTVRAAGYMDQQQHKWGKNKLTIHTTCSAQRVDRDQTGNKAQD